jgi:riboflavin kinase/FMN adenylyltransferase
MTHIKVYRHTNKVCAAQSGSVVAIGNFDGVHLGHKKVLHAAKKQADELNVPLIVVTFEPHPIAVLKPELSPTRLTPFAAKARELELIGANGVYVIKFSKNYAQTTPEEFVTDTLVNILHAKHIFVGDDFSFGKARSGSPEVLAQMGEEMGFEVTAVSQYMQHGERVSSTRIRGVLDSGNIAEMPSLLGRNYSIRTRFVETEMLTLVGYMHNYAPIKNGAYWCEVDYSNSRFTLPVVVIGNKLTIPALGDRPEIGDGVAEISFVEVMQELKDAM